MTRSFACRYILCVLLGLTLCAGDDNLNLKKLSSQAKQARNEAVKHAMNGDCKQAASAYETLLSLGPSFVTADDYNNFGVCLQEEGRVDEAVSTYETGIKLFYHNEKLHRNLGELLEEMSKNDMLSDQSQGWSNETDQRSVRSVSHLTFALRLQLARLWDKHGESAPQQKRIGVGRKTVAIFTRQRSEEAMTDASWGPKLVLGDGMNPEHGEDSLIFVARHLVKMGFNVEVYGNPPRGEVGMDEHGVMWMPFYAIHPMLPPVWNESHVLWPKLPLRAQPNVYISWRNYEAAHLFNSSVHEARNITPPVSYLWLHDVASVPGVFTPAFAAPLHGLILNSEFQAKLMPSRIHNCFFISRAAVEQEPPFVIRQTDNQNHRLTLLPVHPTDHRFLYGGSPLAGLDLVLDQWSTIRSTLVARGMRKEPVLEVLFGFSDQLDKQYAGRRWYQDLKTRTTSMLVQDGVVFKPSLSQRKVSKAYASAGFYLYPTTRYDLSAQHAMKAMVMGAVPVTNRAPLSVLNETCGEFDLGPEPEGGAQEPNVWVSRWTQAVIEAALRPPDELETLREKMIANARERFQWSKVANEWTDRFRHDIETGNTTTCGMPIAQVVTRKDPSEKPADPSEEDSERTEL